MSNITPVTAPMFGKIISIDVKPGDQVQAEQTLMVFESMKMHMNVAAPIAGTIKEIKVAPDEAIKNEQVMVIIES